MIRQAKKFSNLFSISLRYFIIKLENSDSAMWMTRRSQHFRLCEPPLFRLQIFPFLIDILFTHEKVSPDCSFKSHQRPCSKVFDSDSVVCSLTPWYDHRRRIELEDKALGLGDRILAALAVLPWSFWNKRLTSTVPLAALAVLPRPFLKQTVEFLGCDAHRKVWLRGVHSQRKKKKFLTPRCEVIKIYCKQN